MFRNQRRVSDKDECPSCPQRIDTPLGAKVNGSGVNFSVFSKSVTLIELLLFDDENASEPAEMGAVACMKDSGETKRSNRKSCRRNSSCCRSVIRNSGNHESALSTRNSTNACRYHVLRRKPASYPSDRSRFGKKPQTHRCGLRRGGSESRLDNLRGC